MAITIQESEKMWGNLSPFQKKELMSLWEEQQEKKQKYDLNDDVWGLVKEFAGIYHITTEWDKVMKVSAPKLYKWYTANMNVRITRLSGQSAETQKRVILKFFYKKQRNKKTMENLYYLLIPHLDAEKVEKKVKVKKDFTKYKVGQEVIYQPYACAYKCGVIKKVNKCSINVDFYEEEETHEQSENGLFIIKTKHTFMKPITNKNMTIRANFKSDDELGAFEEHKLLYRIWRRDDNN